MLVLCVVETSQDGFHCGGHVEFDHRVSITLLFKFEIRASLWALIFSWR